MYFKQLQQKVSFKIKRTKNHGFVDANNKKKKLPENFVWASPAGSQALKYAK